MPTPKSGKGPSRRPWREIDAITGERPPRKRRKPKGGSAELEPVEPNKPNVLSGGAAAALEFGD
jgi:hypothetical protein